MTVAETGRLKVPVSIQLPPGSTEVSWETWASLLTDICVSVGACVTMLFTYTTRQLDASTHILEMLLQQ